MAGRGRPRYERTEEHAELVEKMAQYGVPLPEIGYLVDCNKDTLLKYYKTEIEKGRAIANAKIGERLFQKAMEGDTTALIFWAKARMRWRTEDKVEQEEEVSNKVTVRKVTAKKEKATCETA